jgi:vancomycin resistance protein VanJ
MTHPTTVPPGILRFKPKKAILKSRWAGIVVASAIWSYLTIILAVWGLLHFGGDRWWFATLMLFGPRWPYALPLVALVPAAVFIRPRLLWVIALTVACLLWPIYGFCVPWRTVFGSMPPDVRVLSCNVGGSLVNPELFGNVIQEFQPDVVVLQEYSGQNKLSWPSKWHVESRGRLVIASRWPIRPVQLHVNYHPPGRWPPTNAVHCVIDRPEGSFSIVDVHLRSPRYALQQALDRQTLISLRRSPVLTDMIEYRRQESESTSLWADDLDDRPLIIAGDFNMPADSSIYRNYWSKYTNAFSTAGFGGGHTKLSPLAGYSYGARIDHILTGRGWRTVDCYVGPDVGSDHLPIIADLHLPSR